MGKKEDISNQTLATLLVVAIVISVGGTYVVLQRSAGITGLITGEVQNGTISFTQQGVLSIRLIDGLSAFGNITLFGFGNCRINTSDTATGTNFTGSNCSAQAADAMTLENDGNVPASILINSTHDKNQTFRLGTGGNQSFRALNAETTPDPACRNTDPTGLTTNFTELPNASQARATVCNSLSNNDSNDALTIHYELIIGTDLPPGNQTENVTFWASLA